MENEGLKKSMRLLISYHITTCISHIPRAHIIHGIIMRLIDGPRWIGLDIWPI